jgi:5-formyltetrahydrofolate cyclo-ligase
MHELDPTYLGLTPDPAEVMRWRKTQRELLIAERLAVPAALRQEQGQAIAAALDAEIGDVAGRTISLYWPFRGEPDLRSWMESAWVRGAVCALPVVAEKKAPLVFRAWRQGEPMERGIWNILVPASSAPQVVPDVVIAPLVGFDNACFRLGYGGGYFDRTLAALGRTPRVIGVGYDLQRIATIRPLVHDIPMDVIVTESGVAVRRA